jgi:hypothetical protein
MGIIKASDIAGCWIDSELVCGECLTDDELADAKLDKIMKVRDVEGSEDFHFCDRCKEQIKAI